MIHRFSDYAANEHTYLAWIRGDSRGEVLLRALLTLAGIFLLVWLTHHLLSCRGAV